MSGDARIVNPAPGTNLADDQYFIIEADQYKLGVFAEKKGLYLSNAVLVDTLVSTLPSGGTNAKGGSAGILAGLTVESYLMHFDTPNLNRSVSGTVTFSTPILGIIWETGAPSPNGLLLDGHRYAKDDLLGRPDLIYPTVPPSSAYQARGIEPDDVLRISADRTSLSFDFSITGPYDQIRIITASDAVPAPAGLPLAGIAIVTLAMRRRWNRAKD